MKRHHRLPPFRCFAAFFFLPLPFPDFLPFPFFAFTAFVDGVAAAGVTFPTPLNVILDGVESNVFDAQPGSTGDRRCDRHACKCNEQYGSADL